MAGREPAPPDGSGGPRTYAERRPDAVRARARITALSVRLPWSNGVVPLAVEVGGFDFDGGHLGFGDLDALVVDIFIEPAGDGEAFVSGCAADQLDNGLVANQGLAAPVLGDEGEQAVLYLVPLCALPRRADVVGANPTRQLSLQPEAPGADQEATNGLKHFGKRSLMGISGPYGPQHKRTPTRPRKGQCESRPASGTGRPPSSGKRARHAPDGLTGVKVAARMAEHQCATREVCLGDHGWQSAGQRRTREGQRRLGQMADGSVRPRKLGNAG